MAKAELKGYLSLNSSRFSKGLDSAAKGIKIFSIAGVAAVAAISAAMIGATKKVWDMTAATSAAGVEWDRMAKMAGISVEELSKYSLVLEKAGVSQDQFADIMKKTAEMMVDAENGATGALEKLDLLGLSFDDMKDKSPLQQFEMITRAMRGMESQTKALGVAEIVFSDAGSAMLPILQMTEEELERNKEAAEDLGAVFDEEATDSSKRFNDALINVKAGLEGIKTDSALVFMDFFTKGLEHLTEMLKEFISSGDIQAWSIEALRWINKFVFYGRTYFSDFLDGAEFIWEQLSSGFKVSFGSMSVALNYILDSLSNSFVAFANDIIGVLNFMGADFEKFDQVTLFADNIDYWKEKVKEGYDVQSKTGERFAALGTRKLERDQEYKYDQDKFDRMINGVEDKIGQSRIGEIFERVGRGIAPKGKDIGYLQDWQKTTQQGWYNYDNNLPLTAMQNQALDVAEKYPSLSNKSIDALVALAERQLKETQEQTEAVKNNGKFSLGN